jgi:hypothetical protein
MTITSEAEALQVLLDERMERRAFVMFRLGGIWRLGQIPEMEG